MILEPFRRQLDDVKRPNGRREIGMPELDTARHGFITDPYGARHYEKLGRFIFQYAQAEAHFHLAFRHYTAKRRSLMLGGGSVVASELTR
jgi:hypothetical protein